MSLSARASYGPPVCSTAATPIDALLNSVNAIRETEVRLAILAIELNPGVGLRHADQQSHDSFDFDVVEPLWAVVDGHLLDLLTWRTFGRREFFEPRQGACRFVPPLPQLLAVLAPEMAKLGAQVGEQAAQHLTDGQGTARHPLRIAMLLTEANRSAGRDGVRMRSKREEKSEVMLPRSGCRYLVKIVSASRSSVA